MTFDVEFVPQGRRNIYIQHMRTGEKMRVPDAVEGGWRFAKALRESGREHVRSVCDPQGLALRDAEFGR